MSESQKNCVDHRWLLVPGGGYEVQKAGYWVCVNCGLKGPSSLHKCPGKDWTHVERGGVCGCTYCSERR